MKKVKLGKIEVNAVGFGSMGLSHGYGKGVSEDEAIDLIHAAHDYGYDHFDTAEVYGDGENEKFVGKAIKPFRKDVVLATKFFIEGQGFTQEELDKKIREHLDASLKRLDTDYVDLYYLHRINPEIPLEMIATTMGKLIKAGLIRGWGMSQANADQIKAAHKVTPLSAIQNEYSIMERRWEKAELPLTEKLGIGFVPFSPLASGFLSGKWNDPSKFKGDDVRRVITRFTPENIKANQPVLKLLHQVANDTNSTPAQVSLAWMMKKWDNVAPIPGASKRFYKENFDAGNLELSDEVFKQLDAAISKLKIHGNRTDKDIMKLGSLDRPTGDQLN